MIKFTLCLWAKSGHKSRLKAHNLLFLNAKNSLKTQYSRPTSQLTITDAEYFPIQTRATSPFHKWQQVSFYFKN